MFSFFFLITCQQLRRSDSKDTLWSIGVFVLDSDGSGHGHVF